MQTFKKGGKVIFIPLYAVSSESVTFLLNCPLHADIQAYAYQAGWS